MPRQKKPTYEWVPKRGYYRKRIKDERGKYIEVTGHTVPELESKLEQARRQIQEAGRVLHSPTVEEYCQKWLEMHGAHIRATTLADYRSKVNNYIIGPLGQRRMDELTPDDISLAIAPVARMSASVYRSVQMLYKMIWASACKSRICATNPCEDLNPRGGIPPKEKAALTDQQVDILLQAIRKTDAYPFCMLGLYAGLRREEILGLQWDCVHLDGPAPHLDVRRAWHTENNRPVVLDQLKTQASRRTVPLPPQLVTCLQELPRTSAYVISRTGGPLTSTQWRALWKQVTVRTTAERSYTRYKDGRKEVHTVRPVLGQAAPHNPECICSMDFHPTPHQLRHTYITRLLLAGVDVKTVQHLAGHERAGITLDIYAHLTYDRPEDLISKVTAAFD